MWMQGLFFKFFNFFKSLSLILLLCFYIFLTPALWLGCPVVWWTNTQARENAFVSPPCCTRTLRAPPYPTQCPRVPLPLHSPQWRILPDQAAWQTSCSTSRRPWWSLFGGTTLPGLFRSPWMPTSLTCRWVESKCFDKPLRVWMCLLPDAEINIQYSVLFFGYYKWSFLVC